MASRSMGSLTISFGLIAIPVNLYSATQSAGSISFNLLHKDCGSRLKQQYVCIKENVVVERDDMVKGYEYAKNQYVQFTPEEIKRFDEVGTHTIEIAEFVSIDAIDPMYFDKAYYLAPDGVAKPYALLTEALQQTNRCAVARWATRGNSNIVILRPIGNVLVMQQLRFVTEVRPVAEIDIPTTEVKPAELKLAKQLIEQQAADEFDPTLYVDDVQARIRAAIEKKAAGGEFTLAEPKAETSNVNVIDIMEALRASLKGTQRPSGLLGRTAARKAPKRVEQPTKAMRKASPR
jgi:DNA end-binding protein Ku